MNPIKVAIEEVNRMIAKLNEEKLRLQNACNHPGLISVQKSDTGNYDPTHDCWWVEFTCPNCGKFWREDQ